MAVPVEFSTIKNQADGAFRAGDFESAAAAYTQALEVLQSFKGDGAASVEADRLRIHSNRSLTFQKLQKWTEALEDAKKAVELDPKRSKSWFRIGQTLVGLDLFAEAVIAYDTGCKLDPRYAEGAQQATLGVAGPSCVACMRLGMILMACMPATGVMSSMMHWMMPRPRTRRYPARRTVRTLHQPPADIAELKSQDVSASGLLHGSTTDLGGCKPAMQNQENPSQSMHEHARSQLSRVAESGALALYPHGSDLHHYEMHNALHKALSGRRQDPYSFLGKMFA